MRTIETTIEVSESTRIIELLKILIDRNLINKNMILDEKERLRENIVILIDNMIVSDTLREINSANKIVIMPLAVGG